MKDRDTKITPEHPELDRKHAIRTIVRKGLKPLPGKRVVRCEWTRTCLTGSRLKAPPRCIRAIVSAIEADDANVRSSLISTVLSYPAEWQNNLAEAFEAKADEENPAVHLNDGTPFLSAPTKDELDDDIPF